MSNNIAIPDFGGTSKTMRTIDDGSAHTPITISDVQWLTASFTRPANATAYTAGDIVNNSTSAPVAMTFTNAGQRNGGPFTIAHAILESSNAPPGTIPAFDLLLFRGSAAPTAQNDNAAFAPSDADMALCFGVIQFTAGLVSSGSNNFVYYAQPTIVSMPDSGGTSIYGMLRINGSYTPLTGEVFTVGLGVIRD